MGPSNKINGPAIHHHETQRTLSIPMCSTLYSLSSTHKPATTMPTQAISAKPLKSEKHPLALFHKTDNKKSINTACIIPSLIVLSAELFTPKQQRETSQTRAVPTIIITTTSECSETC